MDGLMDTCLRWLRLHKVAARIHSGEVVCDIGCGPHHTFLKYIQDVMQRGIGLDKEVTNRTEENIELRRVFVETELPVEDASVDVVSMLAVLEHIEHDATILRECVRILKPGGRIVITVPTHANKPIGEFLAYRLKLIDAEQYRDHKRYYNKAELKEDLERAGFTDSTLAYWEFGMNLFAEARKPAL